jgi:hypothetical protein
MGLTWQAHFSPAPCRVGAAFEAEAANFGNSGERRDVFPHSIGLITDHVNSLASIHRFQN